MATWELVASFKRLPKSISLDRERVQVLTNDRILPNVLPEHRANKTGLKHLLQGSDKCQLLERYGNLFWICWDVTCIDLQDVEDEFVGDEPSVNWAAIKEWNHLSLRELLPLWKDDVTSSSTFDNVNIDMKPPGEVLSSQDVMKVDPGTYFETKYYDSLFNIHLPLAYFVKSDLGRLKNACITNLKDKSVYLTIILRKLLNISDFDKRHADEGLLRDEVYGIAAERRRSCFAKHRIPLDKEKQNSSSVKELPGILKIREIKLQIIILLETIAYNKLDENFENFETKYQSKLKRRSLNLTRRRALPMKSKLIRDSDNNISQKVSGQLDYCEQLDLYLDKLCILDILLASEPASVENETMDTILEHKRNILNKNKEASSMGYTNYVLIPYFAKKLPNAIRFTIQKLKGPSLKSRKNSEKVFTVHPTTVSAGNLKNNLQNSSNLSSTVSSPQLATISSWRRHNAAATTPNSSNTRRNSNIGMLLESTSTLLKKPALVSRSKSDLTMNLMMKRQLSVTEFSSYDRSLIPNEDPGNLERSTVSKGKNQQKSFRRVGKRKGDKEAIDGHRPSYTSDGSEAIQVMGTPLVKVSDDTPSKRPKLQNIVESPMGDHTLMKTPSQKFMPGNVQETQMISRTPGQVTVTNKPKKNIKRRLFAP